MKTNDHSIRNSLCQHLCEKSNEDTIIKRIVKEDIRKYYKFEKFLGSGAFGTVRVAHRLNSEVEKKYAIKSIDRKTVEDDADTLDAELSVMLQVDSPHIVKFYEVYYDSKYLHIVMENVEGGDLMTQLLETD